MRVVSEISLTARLEAFHKALEAASDDRERARILGGALRMCGTWQPLPLWLFKALDDLLLALAHYPQGPKVAQADWLASATARSAGSKQPIKDATKARMGRKWEAASEEVRKKAVDAVRKNVKRENKRLRELSRTKSKVGTKVGA